MDYTPRYPQPFTLGEAVHLDVLVISEEIARLQNSLVHLKSTQEQLREANEEAPDPEFEQAMKENEDVIGSQQERISILRMALAEKGLSVSCHAAGPGAGAGVNQPQSVGGQEDMSQQHSAQPSADTVLADVATHAHDIVVDEDGGIDL